MSAKPAAAPAKAPQHDHPPEGYGVVPFGSRFLPVKWEPDAGEGAYRPLQSDKADKGIPHIAATYGEACDYAWLAKSNAEAMLQPTLELDEPGLAARLITAIKPRRKSGRGKSSRSAKPGRKAS